MTSDSFIRRPGRASAPFPVRAGSRRGQALILGLAVLFSLSWALPVCAQNQLVSRFARKPPRVDGRLGWGEWEGAATLPFERGIIAVQNDDTRLYFLIDVLGQRENDPEDYFWLTFDVDRDGKITEGMDVNYAPTVRTGELRYQFYLGPGRWSAVLPETLSGKAESFDSFLADQSTLVDPPRFVQFSPHRVWEVAVDLKEIGAEPGGMVRCGIRVALPAVQYLEDLPPRFASDFSNLIAIDLSRFIFRLPLGDPDATISLQGDALEVTQAIQTRQNTLPLVQDKTTVARVYLNVSGTSAAQPVWVYLYGKRGGLDLPGSPLTKLAHVPTTVDRARLADTPWFVLPASWPSGTVEFRVKFRTTYAVESTSAPLNLTFTPKRIPNYWIVPINTGTTASPTLVSDAEIASQESYLRASYPLAGVNFVRKPWSAVGPTTVANTITSLRTYHSQIVLGWALVYLFTGSPPFDLPQQIYGFTPSGGGISDPIWDGGLGYVARGFLGTSQEGTMAHEINHNLDRDASGSWGHHTPFGCGAIGPDPSWPYGNDDIQEVGFDTRSPIDADNVVRLNFPDFMSYCQSGATPTKWISPYRWNNLFNVFPNGTPAALTGAPFVSIPPEIQTVLVLSGEVTRRGGGRLNPVFVQPGILMEPMAKGEYAVVLMDEQRAELRTVPFLASFVDVEGNEVDTVPFAYQVAAREGVAEIQLRHGREVLSSLRISKNPPEVRVISPNGGEAWKGLESIVWEARDADQDTLTFNILYTPNDGETWVPVASGLRGNRFEVDSSTLPGGNRARIRVMASDGFNTSQDDSDRTFTVPNQPPRTVLVQPRPGTRLLAGDVITFEAQSEDMEGGALPESSFIWLDGPTVFGLGPKVEAILPEGKHDITLLVVDAEGMVSETMIPLTVRPDSGIRLEVAQLGDGSVRIAWPVAVRGLLLSAANPAGPYENAGLPVQTEGETAFVLAKPDRSARFFRLVFDQPGGLLR